MDKLTIGVGVCTYNRIGLLKTLVARLKITTAHDVPIIVASDGSTDGTNEWLQLRSGVGYVIGPRMGNCVNKNRLLAEFQKLGTDIIFVLEDDVVIRQQGWAEVWAEAIYKTDIHHFTLFDHNRHTKERTVSVKGWDVGVWKQSNAAIHTHTKQTLETVGGYTTAFHDIKRCGHGELSRRMLRAGFCGSFGTHNVSLDSMDEFLYSSHPPKAAKDNFDWKALREHVRGVEARLDAEDVTFRPVDTMGGYLSQLPT
jgi:glycosyltransferase involved in cell wall biosynthesis